MSHKMCLTYFFSNGIYYFHFFLLLPLSFTQSSPKFIRKHFEASGISRLNFKKQTNFYSILIIASVHVAVLALDVLFEPHLCSGGNRND